MKLTFLCTASVFLAVCVFASEKFDDGLFDGFEKSDQSHTEEKLDEKTLQRLKQELDKRAQKLKKQEEDLQTRETKRQKEEKNFQEREEKIQKSHEELNRRESLLDEREQRLITQEISFQPNDAKMFPKQKKCTIKILSKDILKLIASYLDPPSAQQMKNTQTDWNGIEVYKRLLHPDNLIIFLHLTTDEYILQWKESWSDLFEWMDDNRVDRVKEFTGNVINYASTPLITAARRINQSVRWYINVNEVTSYGISALHAAASVGNNTACRILVEAGANVNARTTDGFTPMHLAAKNGHCVRFLYSAGSEINSQDEYGRTPLMYASKYGQDMTISSYLLGMFDADGKIRDVYGRTALMYAAKNGHTEVVRRFMNSGSFMRSEPNVNIQDVNGRTALIYAAKNGHKQIVILLIKSGANINIHDNGRTALMYAAQNGNAEIERILLFLSKAN